MPYFEHKLWVPEVFPIFKGHTEIPQLTIFYGISLMTCHSRIALT